MRPYIGMQEFAQHAFVFECDLALANPFEHTVSPEPLGNEPLVLFGKMQRQIQLALLQNFGARIRCRQHVFGGIHYGGEIGDALGSGVN